MPICSVTGQNFEISKQERELRIKFGVDDHEPGITPWVRFRELGAFWQHWHLYRRKCDRTGDSIIATFGENCPYPVWQHDEWVRHADPPGADFDVSREVFSQMWEFFQKSPLPHTTGTGNENCEYTDDWWYGKNCYLCHSGVNCEDLRYCYRMLDSRDCQFCTFTFDSELCIDLVSCHRCFNMRYAVDCRNCRDSAFLYDCRGCCDCMFCHNLRNKNFCFGNQQLTETEYRKKSAEWDFSSRRVYDRARGFFGEMMRTTAWHRALHVDHSENCVGNFLDRDRNCENCYFCSDTEDSVNFVRGGVTVRNLLDIVGAGDHCELLYSSVNPMDHCYHVRWCVQPTQCKFCDYCAYCFQCENCFGCCGLVGKKFYIFNQPYSEEEYQCLIKKIEQKMRSTGEWGKFFPGYFAPMSYEESFSAMVWPLDQLQQEKLGFRVRENLLEREAASSPAESIPDRADASVGDQVFWDANEGRPFKILATDIELCQKMQVPLPNEFYSARLKKNYAWLPFDGTLRETTCAKSGERILTVWGEEYDGRILGEGAYLDVVG